jgi:phosphoribosylformimino-5-aminoimidazole carboxamide ribotide isomerase
LHELCERFGPERILFSLDMQAGRLMGEPSAWGVAPSDADAPFAVAERAVDTGVTQLIVLDLAQVGTHAGIATLGLCRRLIQRFPNLRVHTGGGVRGPEDLATLESDGIAGVLIASALHDGSLTREHLDRFSIRGNVRERDKKCKVRSAKCKVQNEDSA